MSFQRVGGLSHGERVTRSRSLVTMISWTVKQSLEIPRDFDLSASPHERRCAELLPSEGSREPERSPWPSAPPRSEWVRLEEALGRALGAEVLAQRTLPPGTTPPWTATRCAAPISPGPCPSACPWEKRSTRGRRPSSSSGPGTCARIMTGAPLPPGADAVVMQERTRALQGPGARRWRSSRPCRRATSCGPEARTREPASCCSARGTPLGIPELGLLIAQGMLTVPVPRRPRVAILSTGDELCRADEAARGPHRRHQRPLAGAGGAARRADCPRCWASRGTRWRRCPRAWRRPRASTWCSPAPASPWASTTSCRPRSRSWGWSMDFWRVAIKPGKPLAVGRRGAPSLRPARQPHLLAGHLRAVRPPGAPAPAGPSRTWSRPRCPAGWTASCARRPGWPTTSVSRPPGGTGELWARPLATQTSGALRSAASATHLLHFPREASSLAHGAPGRPVARLLGSVRNVRRVGSIIESADAMRG